MPLPAHLRPWRLALALLLAACTTVDKPVDIEPAKPTQKVRPPTSSSRPGAAKPTPFADDGASRTVYFAFGETTIDSQGSAILRQNAQKLKEDPQLLVVLVGHTDNQGSPAYNLAVADKRTEAVSERLRSFGVPRNQIRRLPVGSEESSKVKCDSDACRQRMRRVELVYEWR
jgi:outer membrane protein OmpA-like peptidoglycan-associated protein